MASFATFARANDQVQYNRDIRPLLANHCFRCHGPDNETREAGLRLDKSEDAYRELDSGFRAVVPGKIASSELLVRVQSDDDDETNGEGAKRTSTLAQAQANVDQPCGLHDNESRDKEQMSASPDTLPEKEM